MDDFQEQEIYILIGFSIAIMLVLAVAFIIFYFLSQRKMFLQKMKSQEQLIQHTIMAQEEERSRIAKDMHDEIGSKLNVISLHTQQLKNLMSNHTGMLESIGFITETIHDTIGTTRRIAHDLLPPTLEEFGLYEATQELCDAYTSTGKLDISLDADRNCVIDNRLIELNLFRILQELVNNSLKHGHAKKIEIKCAFNNGQLQISYKDNGKGFDSTQKRKSKGLGMNSIDSRIKIIKGKWDYSSSPGNGMEAQIYLSLAP